MPPLRRRYWVLSGLLVALGLATVLSVVLPERAAAETVAGAAGVDLLSWVSISSLLALLGVAVQWGATRERLKDITTLEDRIDGRFNRVERQIDALFSALQAERRSEDRARVGERVHPEANGA